MLIKGGTTPSFFKSNAALLQKQIDISEEDIDQLDQFDEYGCSHETLAILNKFPIHLTPGENDMIRSWMVDGTHDGNWEVFLSIFDNIPPLPEGITVYRGVILYGSSTIESFTYINTAISTTICKMIAENFADRGKKGLILEIHVPAGEKVLPLLPSFQYNDAEEFVSPEYEVVLPRGTLIPIDFYVDDDPYPTLEMKFTTKSTRIHVDDELNDDLHEYVNKTRY